MTLQASGAISFQDLATEFGGTAPHSINEYYRSGGLVPNSGLNSGIPSSGQVSLSQYYGSSVSALLNGLVSFWEFEEAAGSGTRVDRQGNNSLVASGAHSITTGVVGNAVNLIAQMQKVTPVVPNGNGARFTIGVWVRRFGASITNFNFAVDTASDRCFGFESGTANNTTRAFVVNNTTLAKVNSNNMAISNTAFNLIFAWFDGTNLNTAVNGGAASQFATAHDSIKNGATQLTFTGSNGVDVYMDQAFLYNRVLSAGERASMYNGGAGRSFASL